MINYISLIKRFYIAFLFIATSMQLSSQHKGDFANSLMRERDYFRAISIYKELIFYTSNRDSSILYLSQIGKAYRLSQKYELSVETYTSLLNKYILSDSIYNSVYMNLGLNYLGMRVPAQAISYFEEANKKDSSGVASLYLGVVYVEMSNWEKAQIYFSNNEKSKSSAKISDMKKEFSLKLSEVDQLSYRDPLTASILSTVIPGAGQFYSNHYIDAIQAFGFVASFSFATYLAYKNDKHYSSNYVLTGVSLSITGLFHLANIIGAERTATYFNQRQKDIFLQDIRQKSLNIDL